MATRSFKNTFVSLSSLVITTLIPWASISFFTAWANAQVSSFSNLPSESHPGSVPPCPGSKQTVSTWGSIMGWVSVSGTFSPVSPSSMLDTVLTILSISFPSSSFLSKNMHKRTVKHSTLIHTDHFNTAWIIHTLVCFFFSTIMRFPSFSLIYFIFPPYVVTPPLTLGSAALATRRDPLAGRFLVALNRQKAS